MLKDSEATKLTLRIRYGGARNYYKIRTMTFPGDYPAARASLEELATSLRNDRDLPVSKVDVKEQGVPGLQPARLEVFLDSNDTEWIAEIEERARNQFRFGA